METFRIIIEVVSQWTIPALMLTIALWAAWKKVPLYESFITGAKEGFEVGVMIIPYLVAILVVIKVFIASGIFADIKTGATWVLAQVGMEQHADTFELLPLALTRPLSGGASRGMLVEVLDAHGPDTFLGNTASIMMGSSETTFYILSVYFGAVGVKRMRHTLPACLISDGIGLLVAVVLGYVLFA